MKLSFKYAAFLSSCFAMLMTSKAQAVGSAGCGLGSLVFKDNTWWKQLLAATTNGTFGSQTFGITSGTSNCAKGLLGDLQKQKDFMAANYSSLQRELAQGQGPTVNGLASILGCEASSYNDFGSFTQSQYKTIFNSNNPDTSLDVLKISIQNNSNLSSRCKLANI